MAASKRIAILATHGFEQSELMEPRKRLKDAEVVIDGHLITSRKPDDIPAFTEAVSQALQ